MANNIFDGNDDGSIDGSAQSDIIYGGTSVGNADSGAAKNDTIDGGQSDDTIFAGDGNDLIFGGDAGDAMGGGNGAKNVDSFEFDIYKADPVQSGTGAGHIGDSILYRGVATADDGSPVNVRVTIVDQSNPNLRIELGYNSDYPILINEGSNTSMQGETVDVRVEFLDSAGNPITINSNFTFRDLDDTGSNGNEGVTFDTTDITSYAVSDTPPTNVQVDDRGDEIEFTTNTSGDVENENLWTQVFFEGQSSLNFTLESRAHNAGYGFDTADFQQPPVITEVDASGNDLLYGGAGDDSALGGGGADTIYGEDGDDRLDGGEGTDTLFGGNGADTFIASDGADTIFGGAGQDVVDYSDLDQGIVVDLTANTASNGDVLQGVDGIVGSSHDDTLIGFDADASGTDAFTNVFYGGTGDDLLDGRGGADSLFAGHGTDSVLGGAGDDFIDGGTGSDTIDAGTGNDSVIGGFGDESISGNAGNDTVDGGAGSDLVFGGTGQDSLLGGTDADTLYGGDQDDSIDAGSGSDTVYGDSGDDVLVSGEGSDVVYGGSGDDTFVLQDESGTDALDGGTGVDVVDASGLSSGVNVTLGQNDTNTVQTDTGFSIFEDVEKLILTADADTVVATGGTDGLTIDAGAGNDSIQGGAGNDVIDGGAGKDTIVGGAGDNVLTGGEERDIFVLEAPDYSDLGTAEEIRAAILDANLNGIDGWRGIKGESQTSDTGEAEQTSEAAVFDVADIGHEVGDALKPLMGKKAADKAEKEIETAIENYLDENPGVEISAKDISTVVFETLKPEIGFIKAGIASLKSFSVAKDQIEIASDPSLGDPSDIDYKKIGDGVEDALEASLGKKDAKDISKDVEKDVKDFLKDIGNDPTRPEQIGDIVFEVVNRAHGGEAADIARAAVEELAAEQMGVVLGGTVPGTGTPTEPSGGEDTLAGAIFERATHQEITDFEIGVDKLDLSSIDYLGEAGLSTNDVRITDTSGDGSGDAVINLPDGSSLTLRGVSVFDLDPETLENMGFNESADSTAFQNEFLRDAGQIGGGGGDDAITGSGNDETIEGGDGADTLVAGGGADVLRGGRDADQIVIDDDFEGASVDGGETGDDLDTLDFTNLTDAVNVEATGATGGSFKAGTVDPDNPSAQGGTFRSIEDFDGSGSNDRFALTGHRDAVTVDGQEGDDSISGGGGNDTLIGGEGDDFVSGGIGSDIIYGGVGNDSLKTGTGNDTLFGGEGDDNLANSSGDDILYGGTGDDTVTASLGDDTLYGGADDDDLIGGLDNDVLYGGTGDDSLVGGSEIAPTATKFSFEYYETAGETNSTLADVGFDASGNTTRTPDGHGTIDTIDVNSLDAAQSGDGETFAVKYTTTLTVTSGGTYTFETTSDDGSKLFVNGTEIVDNDGLHPLETESGSLALGAGEHVVEVIYFEATGGDGLSVTVSGPDTGGAAIDLATASIAASDDDLLIAGAGNDQLDGGIGDDTLYGGDDQDTITVQDNFGSDTVYGGEGGADSDTLDLSALGSGVTVTYTGPEEGTFTDGTDTATFFEIENILLTDEDDSFDGSSSTGGLDIDGAGGNDTISGSEFNSNGDSIFGGAGNDVLDGLSGNDTVFGGAGNDTIKAGFGADTYDGGSGIDTYDIASSNVSAFGFNVNLSSGNDQFGNSYSNIENITGGSGDDVFIGDGNGNRLDGQGGSDDLDGGAGNDTVLGGSGNDTLDGGVGNDTLTGGSGNDTFQVSASGGDDTITDFGDGDDQIDSSALTDIGNVATDQDGTVTADEVVVTGGGGSAQVLTFPNGETITVPDGTVDTSTTATQFASLVAMGVPPCFAPGTMILTPTGEVAVESLKAGDLVMTADHGPQPLRWVGRRVETFESREDPHKPILIAKGAMGHGFPTRDLIVSPQHRMVLSGKIPETLFGQREVMGIAKALTTLKGIRRMAGKTEITYFALLLDRHEVIFAEGAATESFRPGPTVLKGMDDAARREIYTIYPKLEAEPINGLGDPARQLLNGRDTRRIARRILGSDKNRAKRQRASASVHKLHSTEAEGAQPTV